MKNIQKLSINQTTSGINKLYKLSLIFIMFLLLSLEGCAGNRTISGNDISDNDASGTDISGISDISGDSFRVSPDLIASMASPTDTGDLTVTEEMIDTGIFNPGNTYRLSLVMERAAQGEDITIAYIGGSITNGDSASPKETSCYAYLSTEWWRETFPDASINYINAGIGATDSYLGVHRLRDDVLSYEPDLVIVEFSVNDSRSWNKETYESLLRTVLESENEPAVISLLLGMEQPYNYASEHAQAAFKSGVSIISYAAVLSDGMKDGSIPWNLVGNADGVHPNNQGHALIAHLLTQFYSNVLSDINTVIHDEYIIPEGSLTKVRYEDADLLYATDITPVSMEGFEQAEVPSPLSCKEGWTTETGGTIAFEITGREAGIVYYCTTDGNSGQFDVYVDGVCTTTIDADFTGGWGNYCDYSICFVKDTSATHLIEIKPAESSTGDALAICGICVAY